jgi:chromosome segregation ATPase
MVKAESAGELQRTVEEVRGQRDEALEAARAAQRAIRDRDVDLEAAGSALERQRAALLATEHDHLFAFEDAKRGRVAGQWGSELIALLTDARAAMALQTVHANEMTRIARDEGDRLALSIHDLRQCMSQAVSSEAELKDDVATLRAQRQVLEAELRTFRERAAASELREQSLHAKVDRAQSHLASMAEELQAATRRADTSSRVAEDSMAFTEEQQAALHALRARASTLQSAANSIAAELETLLASPGSGEPPGVSEARALLRDAMYDLADCRRTDGLAAASSQSLSAAFERIRQAQESCFPRSFEAVCWARTEAIAAVRRVREAVDGLGI